MLRPTLAISHAARRWLCLLVRCLDADASICVWEQHSRFRVRETISGVDQGEVILLSQNLHGKIHFFPFFVVRPQYHSAIVQLPSAVIPRVLATTDQEEVKAELSVGLQYELFMRIDDMFGQIRAD